MPRSYRDRAELRTTPVSQKEHPLTDKGTVILLGIGFPAVEGPVPVMLVPGYEYRIREIATPEDGQNENNHGGPGWLIERRKV